jgi:DNA-binding CsgD family transcriptional regulator/tetratricopeptide (TPR) repeat protein
VRFPYPAAAGGCTILTLRTPRPLVERDEQLQALTEVFAEPFHSGSVVLLSGEAGFGKTSLLHAGLDTLDHKWRVLLAISEPLDVPGAFTPLYDLIAEVPPELQQDIRSGTGRMPVYLGMLDLLKNDRVVLVLEDVHWADEATLGLVRYLGKRVGATQSALIVTFRSEEIHVNPPLRLVVADLGPSAIRIELPPLTVSGVEELARGTGLDPRHVHDATLGNPFFVDEVLMHPDVTLPPTIQYAVLANAAQLPEDVLEFVNTVALSPDGVPLADIAEFGDPTGSHCDLAFSRRLVTAARGQVSCRHELIRKSLVEALPPATKTRLHTRLLDHLEGMAPDSRDVARLAYHAIGAGNAEKAAKYSLLAGEHAAAGGAHRQAAFHLANAIEFADVIETTALDGALLSAAREHNYINAFETAVDFSRRRLELAKSPLEEARSRAWVAYFEHRLNNLDAAAEEAEAALEILRGADQSEEFAVALAGLASVTLVRGDLLKAISLAEEALSMAQSCGSTEMEVSALTTLATARYYLGEPDGLAQMEAAARRGIDGGAGESGAKALNNLGGLSRSAWKMSDARKWFLELREYSTAHELDAWYIAAVITSAGIAVEMGLWDDADAYLEVVAGQRTCYSSEVEMLVVAAMLRTRRADPGAKEMVEAVFDRLETYNAGVWTLIEACVMAMEATWSGIIPVDRVAALYQDLIDLVPDGAHHDRAMLAFWAHRLGWEPPRGEISGPMVHEIAGRPSEAATEWDRCGYRIQASISRALTPDADLDEVFSDLAALGADGVARGLRRELQRRGVKRVPRGERSSTRENPAGLTAREAEVLSLLAGGLSNAAIAEKLFISNKTASHHVSSVLLKLNVSSRGQAAALAVVNGWNDPK